MTRGFYLIVAALVACLVATTLGTPAASLSRSAAAEIWSDVLRDADQVPLHLTRLSDEQEVAVGQQLADAVPFPIVQNPSLQNYVGDVAQPLLANIERKNIRYEFRVVQSTESNAFALPGGHVYITDELLKHLRSEAELAFILGHEIAHVDLRHCVEPYQYRATLAAPGATLAQLARAVASIAFTQEQEVDADLRGASLLIDARYWPKAAAGSFDRLRYQVSSGYYFNTHPSNGDRQLRLNRALDARDPTGRFYLGIRNFQVQDARVHLADPSEWFDYADDAKVNARLNQTTNP